MSQSAFMPETNCPYYVRSKYHSAWTANLSGSPSLGYPRHFLCCFLLSSVFSSFFIFFFSFPILRTFIPHTRQLTERTVTLSCSQLMNDVSATMSSVLNRLCEESILETVADSRTKLQKHGRLLNQHVRDAEAKYSAMVSEANTRMFLIIDFNAVCQVQNI